MDSDYWKKAYQNTWEVSSGRESEIAELIKKETGLEVIASGLGSETSEFISGSASQNGFEKGDPDLRIAGSNIYMEVTGPLSEKVRSSSPLWFRPDKIENAKNNLDSHDTFLLHNCPGEKLWRVIHVDKTFIESYDTGKYKTVRPRIRGNTEQYVEIPSDAECIIPFSELISYLKSINNKICPKCGNILVRRTARTGFREGLDFWGCSTYPNCKYIMNID
ncbi:TPA: topoisomerase DNA-binding C4 zinc finger domain-containing protein [Streptococcus suis]|nr:hypothetical protein [Streptococcus suis]NQI87801.1 hypothetical protein [Streptococcus suis]NQI92489.1 hypothetical protein [Streptococcus suis]NQJ00338.1 hypothetical protein [Streptococcus suis]HEP1795359.1 topoisomerase DNA-binding C4 zinc finger domain-containing protein [Streptococcus suis]